MDTNESWEYFLNPKNLRQNLISFALFITNFEMLKSAVVDRIRDFYSIGFDDSGDRHSPNYERRVLSRHRKVTQASLLWLQELGAIDDADIAVFRKLADVRNDLAHEMLNVLSGQKDIDLQARFAELLGLLKKVEVWWVVNVEIATDPAMAEREIDEDGIVPGSLMISQILMDVALGDDERANEYLRKLAEMTKG